MSAIKINADREESYTMLPDLFIEQHMPHANGEFVKIYIYLLQLVQQKRGQFSLSETADVFACTERDITRAIRFWEARGLIEVKHSREDQTIAGIRFVFPERAAAPVYTDKSAAPADPGSSATEADTDSSATAASPGSNAASAFPGSNAASADQERSTVPADPGRSAGNSTPDRFPATAVPDNSKKRNKQGSQVIPALSNDRTASLMREQTDVRHIVTIAEQYLGRTLSSSDLNRLLYLYDELHFSVDLIDYLIEYCVLKEKRSMHYIEKVGLEWYNDGVKTVAEARERTISWNRDYYRILRAFGITNRNPVTKEIQYMKKWLTTFRFPMDLIQEACGRTVTQTGRVSFEYADRILTSWHTAGVKTLADIPVLDQKHSSRQSAKQDSAKHDSGKRQTGTGSGNRFNNFTQREYDFHSLEQQLLQNQQAKTETK